MDDTDPHATHFRSQPEVPGASVHTSPDAEGDGMNLDAKLALLEATVVAAGMTR